MQQGENAWVKNGIMNLKAVPPRFHDATRSQPLELIRDCLRLHSQYVCYLTDAQLTRAGEGVQHPQARGVGQQFESGLQPLRLPTGE